MKKRILNTAFVCQNCKREVLPIQNGSYRNHCPFCLFSLHVDGEVPGDRKKQLQGAYGTDRDPISYEKGISIDPPVYQVRDIQAQCHL